MVNHYVLIDYENVQPKHLAVLQGHPVKVMVFIGTNQTKLPIEMVAELQPLGASAEYKTITGNGRNALDFHIAFYLGELIERDPGGNFHVISKDTGFDVLIRHLQARGLKVGRSRDLPNLPFLRMTGGKTTDEQVAMLVANLAMRGHARPRKVKTLANTINSLFQKNLSESELATLVELLRQREHIDVKDGHVSYNL